MPLKLKETNKSPAKFNRLKNLNWREADQLAIYKHYRGFELGSTEKQLQPWSEQDLNLRPPDFKSGALTMHSATLPAIDIITCYLQEQRQAFQRGYHGNRSLLGLR